MAIRSNQSTIIERGADITVENSDNYNLIASDGNYIGDGVNEVGISPTEMNFYVDGEGNLILTPASLSGNRTQTFQDKSGDIALLSDIPTPTSLGNFLFVSPSGSATQTRTDGVGRIDKPFTLAQAIAVHQNNDVIYVFGNTTADYAAITIDNPLASQKTLRFVLVDASILNLTINNTGGGIFTVYIEKGGSSGFSRVRNNLNLVGNSLQVICNDVTVGTNLNISGNDNQYTGKNHKIGTTLNVTGANASISLENCSVFLETGVANTITTLDVQGGAFGCRINGLVSGLMSIFNARNGAANMIEIFGSTVNLGANMLIVNCLHYYLPADGFLVKMDAVTTWTDTTKQIKIINCAVSGSVQNAVPAIAPNVEISNVIQY